MSLYIDFKIEKNIYKTPKNELYCSESKWKLSLKYLQTRFSPLQLFYPFCSNYRNSKLARNFRIWSAKLELDSNWFCNTRKNSNSKKVGSTTSLKATLLFPWKCDNEITAYTLRVSPPIVVQVKVQCSGPDFCQASWARVLRRPPCTPAQLDKNLTPSFELSFAIH